MRSNRDDDTPSTVPVHGETRSGGNAGGPAVGAEDRIDAVLTRISRLVMAATVRAGNVAKPPLSPTQVRTLTVLASAEDGLSLTAVADLLATSLSSASRIIQRLVRDRLVDRFAGPGNELRLALSEHGAAVLADVNRVRVAPLRSLLNRLPVADHDAAVTALEHIVGAARDTDAIW